MLRPLRALRVLRLLWPGPPQPSPSSVTGNGSSPGPHCSPSAPPSWWCSLGCRRARHRRAQPRRQHQRSPAACRRRYADQRPGRCSAWRPALLVASEPTAPTWWTQPGRAPAATAGAPARPASGPRRIRANRLERRPERGRLLGGRQAGAAAGVPGGQGAGADERAGSRKSGARVPAAAGHAGARPRLRRGAHLDRYVQAGRVVAGVDSLTALDDREFLPGGGEVLPGGSVLARSGPRRGGDVGITRCPALHGRRRPGDSVSGTFGATGGGDGPNGGSHKRGSAGCASGPI